MKINRHFLYGLLLLFICNNSFSQNVAVSATKMNVLYADVDNPFSFAVNNKDCNDYQLSSNNGIIKCNDSCHCTINPIEIKPTVIYIKDKTGKLIDSLVYRTKDLPDPVLEACCKGDRISWNYKMSIGVVANVFNFDFDVKFIVKQFDILKYKNDTLLGKVLNIGPYYSEETKKLIGSSKPHDIFYFENIIVVQPSGRERKISGIAFRID